MQYSHILDANRSDKRGGKRILIVDDSEMNLDVLRELLRGDYELESARSGEECLGKLMDISPDLVLLDIPLSARIVALADVFDALTSDRVYKAAIDPEKAKAMIVEERGEHFDPVVVDAFLARFADFLKVVRREGRDLSPADDMVLETVSA